MSHVPGYGGHGQGQAPPPPTGSGYYNPAQVMQSVPVGGPPAIPYYPPMPTGLPHVNMPHHAVGNPAAATAVNAGAPQKKKKLVYMKGQAINADPNDKPPEQGKQEITNEDADDTIEGNKLELWGNEKTMNFNNILFTNIVSSSYFKSLYRLREYSQTIDEVYNEVTYVEPFLGGSKEVPSTAFSLLYKLHTQRVTVRQIQGMLNHKDSPYIRALGFLYLRFATPPKDLLDWFWDYIEDEEMFDPRYRRGNEKPQNITMGRFVRDLLLKPRYCDYLLPRIPVPVQRSIQKQIDEYDDEKRRSARGDDGGGIGDRGGSGRGGRDREYRSGARGRESSYEGRSSHHRDSRDRDRRDWDTSRDRSRDRYNDRGGYRDRDRDRDRGHDRYRPYDRRGGSSRDRDWQRHDRGDRGDRGDRRSRNPSRRSRSPRPARSKSRSLSPRFGTSVDAIPPTTSGGVSSYNKIREQYASNGSSSKRYGSSGNTTDEVSLRLVNPIVAKRMKGDRR